MAGFGWPEPSQSDSSQSDSELGTSNWDSWAMMTPASGPIELSAMQSRRPSSDVDDDGEGSFSADSPHWKEELSVGGASIQPTSSTTTARAASVTILGDSFPDSGAHLPSHNPFNNASLHLGPLVPPTGVYSEPSRSDPSGSLLT
uniref:Uncharacterized protein n=1 Tax=Mycena chlorophos TaxID=658473 RepID=A0ABQ0LEG0_MYCCL|nr:predicted protein [Mycena chlorophos]